MELEPRPDQPESRQISPDSGVVTQVGISGVLEGAREERLGNRFQRDPATLIDLFEKDFHAARHLAFAKNLEDTGLLDELEQAGVLPTVGDMTSPDDELQELQPEGWWQKPPDERDGLLNSLEQRDRALRYIYVGAILGHLFQELLVFPDEEPA